MELNNYGNTVNDSSTYYGDADCCRWRADWAIWRPDGIDWANRISDGIHWSDRAHGTDGAARDRTYRICSDWSDGTDRKNRTTRICSDRTNGDYRADGAHWASFCQRDDVRRISRGTGDGTEWVHHRWNDGHVRSHRGWRRCS